MNENKSFTYSYSAAEQEELRKIREKYLEKDNKKTNLDKIKELDKNSTKGGTIVSLIIGIISSLIMGTGMCCVIMWNLIVLGILVGIIGMVGMIFAYPVYKHMVNIQKNKIREEIIRLCNEEIK